MGGPPGQAGQHRTQGGSTGQAGTGSHAALQPLRWFIESAPHMGEALALSPDGRWLAVGRGFTVAILDAATGNVRMILPGATAADARAVAAAPPPPAS